jgi:hypothetical protein
MNAASRTAATLALLLLVGCGTLEVKVDVLDPEYVRGQAGEEGQRKLYQEIVRAQPGEFRDRVDRQLADYQRATSPLIDEFEKLADKKDEPAKSRFKAIARGWRSEAESGELVKKSNLFRDEFEALAQAMRDLGVKLQWNGRGPIPDAIRQQLGAFEAGAKRFSLAQQVDLDGLRENLRNGTLGNAAGAGAAATRAPAAATVLELDAVKPAAAAAAAVAQRSIIQDNSLAATEFAYIVANAPPKLWATNFNRAYGSGRFGNTDVVIRLNSTADFSVKGLLFDATKVAQVASKVLTQTVLLSAQVAGVPVTSASTGTQTGGDALSKSSADLSTADATLARRQAVLDGQREAIRSAARTILGVAPALAQAPLKDEGVNNDGRKAAHKAINDSIAALDSLLSAQDLQ